MTIKDYDPDDDSRRCYELGLAALRELNIRKGNILPRDHDETEARWCRDGPVPIAQLESGKVKQR